MPAFVLMLLNSMLNFEVDIISLQQLDYEMGRTDYPVDCNFFEIGYCGHLNFPYANIQLKKVTNLILSHFQEEYYPFIHGTLKNKNTQFFSLYFVYRPKKNASIMDITNYDQNTYTLAPTYTFAPTYGDESTAYNSHMISVVVLFYSNKLSIMLVDYAVKEMGCFDDYYYAAPRAKTMRVNCITTFLLQISQCITFHQTRFVTATLIY